MSNPVPGHRIDLDGERSVWVADETTVGSDDVAGVAITFKRPARDGEGGNDDGLLVTHLKLTEDACLALVSLLINRYERDHVGLAT
jgi:hypothetical protein